MDYYTKKTKEIQKLFEKIHPVNVCFSEALSEVLDFYDITEDYIAEMSGLSKVTYNRYKKGQTKSIQLHTLIQMLIEIECDFLIALVLIGKADLMHHLLNNILYIELLIHAQENSIEQCNEIIKNYNQNSENKLELFKEPDA